MKLRITLLITTILFINQIFSQESCGTIESNNYQKISSLSRMKFGNPSTESDLCLNLMFHTVRDDNGIEDNLIRANIDDIISRLNQDFAAHNISFNNYGSDYIDNSAFLDVVASEFNSLMTINNNSNAINIYLVDSATWKGKANGILSQSLLIMKEYSDSGIISHEMGHCLNLLHTHSTQFGVEIQDDCSSGDDLLCNCTHAGDQICDTPPDPGLANNVNNTCQYVGGGNYSPDTMNIMSYSTPSCLLHFTNGQAIRMRDAILNTSFLQSAISCDCSATAIFGKLTICNTETTTYALSCGTASFITSSNLQTISSTNNSITVKPINSSINGEAYVKTTINNTVYQKDIWIGKPKIDLNLTSSGNLVFLDLIGVNSDIHNQNISHIEWEKLSTTGHANMGPATNSFDNLAHGNGTNWIINARIKVENGCGITYLFKDITPESPPCDDYYTINNTEKNKYAAFIIIDPCATTLANNNKEVKVKEKDIVKATLFNLYGYQVKDYKSNSFNTNGLKHGVYIFRVQIKDEVVIKKIIVE